MKRIACVLLSSVLLGCGPKPVSRTPHERYRAAVDAKLAGDGAAYWRELVALAHEAPDSREGRRARATLTSGDLLTYTATTGVLAAIAIPNFLAFQARARQTEARAALRRIYEWELGQKQRTGRFAEALPPTLVNSLGARSYHYFVSPSAPSAGPASPNRISVDRAREALDAMGLRPRAAGKELLVVAVGNIDQDDEIDVWTIDQDGDVNHPLDDLP